MEDTLEVQRQRSPAGRLVAVTSRAMQRVVTAHYLGMSPAAVPILRCCPTCGARGHGRPMVKDAPFVFSVSHSGRWVAMAVSAGSSRALGLDIEVTGNLPDVDALASTVLSRTELATYGSLTVDARQAWIHRMWTRKEAALKAYGDGLSIDPQSVDVGGPTTVVPPAVGEVGGKVVGEVGGDHRAAGAVAERRLHLRDVDVWDGYAAAIATGPDPVARLWSYVVTPDFPTRPR